MADFRRWIYALALVALLAGFTVPVSAQAPPLECIANAGVPPTVRAEGFTELLGDITLNCTGGVPTPAGSVVPPVNVTITINTYLTSRYLATCKNGNSCVEALLIIDEPHSAVNPGRPILACGATTAPDSGPSGSNVCAIISTGNPALTYDGTPNGYGLTTGATTCTGGDSGTPAADSYSCGRPNVFQGQTTTPAVAGQTNVVTWLGVPLDPPGTTTNRTIRITNIRASAHDANGLATAGTFTASYIQAQISISGTTSLALNNPQQIVAFIGPGLSPSTGITATNFSFLQCIAQPSGSVTEPAFTFVEGFASSWKAKNIAMILNTAAGATGNGTPPGGTNAYWEYDGFSGSGGTTNYPKDLNQNVPGAIYNTESGFMYPAGSSLDGTPADPTPNPPAGIGTVPVTATSLAMANGTNIQSAGVADAGTRLQVQISNIPGGVTVTVPNVIDLYNGTGYSGVAVLTNTTDASGDGPFNAATGTSTVINPGQASSGMAVYEILFADPFSVESLTVTTVVSYSPVLASNLPTPEAPANGAQAIGGFAPFGPSHSSGTQIPRFYTAQIPTNPDYFSINRCACDLLFPFVTNQGGYDTGIAIANTSMDNLTNSTAKAQFGGVEFWYYGTLANGGAAPPPQCTNVASPGTCPTPNATSSSSAIGQVPAGQVLTYVLSTSGGSIGTGPNGLSPNWAAGFEGYIIAQAQFQYCHAYAFIAAQGGGPLNAGISEGYLGLVLDNNSWNCAHVGLDVAGLCRTNQSAENLVH